MSASNLAEGVAAHRAFSRRSLKPYNRRLANAEHFAVVGDARGVLIEPLAWALWAGDGAAHEAADRAPAPTPSTFGALEQAGWQRVAPEDERFAALWQALLDWCDARKTAPSIRTGRHASEDRVFWVAPGGG